MWVAFDLESVRFRENEVHLSSFSERDHTYNSLGLENDAELSLGIQRTLNATHVQIYLCHTGNLYAPFLNRNLERAALSPPIGSASIETRNKMAELAAENLRTVLSGEERPNTINARSYSSYKALDRFHSKVYIAFKFALQTNLCRQHIVVSEGGASAVR